jgi:hypothetical protein
VEADADAVTHGRRRCEAQNAHQHTRVDEVAVQKVGPLAKRKRPLAAALCSSCRGEKFLTITLGRSAGGRDGCAG